jgi:hypothetical protein
MFKHLKTHDQKEYIKYNREYVINPFESSCESHESSGEDDKKNLGFKNAFRASVIKGMCVNSALK